MYGFVDGDATGGIYGGVGCGPGFERRVLFYVAVQDVESALRKAKELGGRLMGLVPEVEGFTVGRFADPDSNVIGVAGSSARKGEVV